MFTSFLRYDSSDRDDQNDNNEEEEEEVAAPDRVVELREQTLRALLVMMPAKVMEFVLKTAVDRAVLHLRRTATAEAERQRHKLASSKAEFRHTRQSTRPKVRWHDSDTI